ncbi:MAG TPA: DUF6461 domain-containing protein [Marmoricola sp.]|nr:DUF6461 domain-containing protein [Marmoricola sp.]
MATPDEYAWIHEVLSDAACVTAVTGTTEVDVLRAFGADSAAQVPLEDAFGTGETGCVSVVGVDGGVIAIEFNGFLGSLPEVLTSLSIGGLAASMFWNVNDDNAFSCARHGELLTSVDLYDAEDPDDVDVPVELRQLFESAGREDADLHATGVAMVAQFAGVGISADVVASIRSAHPIN